MPQMPVYPDFKAYDLVKIKVGPWSKPISEFGLVLNPVQSKYEGVKPTLWKVQLIKDDGSFDYKILHYSNFDLI